MARALVGLDRSAEAVTIADEGLALAQEKGYLPLLWQLHAVRGSALARLDLAERAEGDRQAAAALVRNLAEDIDNPQQRRGFLAYPEVVAITAD